MVFKVVGGALPETVGQLWRSIDAHSENVTDALDTTTTFFGQYKNRIVMDWQTFQPQEVRVLCGTIGFVFCIYCLMTWIHTTFAIKSIAEAGKTGYR